MIERDRDGRLPSEQSADDGERGEVADVDEVGGEELDPDEGKDESDRLVQVAEATH